MFFQDLRNWIHLRGSTLMGEVVTMAGTPLLRCRELLDVIKEREDIEHVVVVIERTDGMSEIYFDRQSHANVVFASAVLSSVANELAKNAVAED